MPSLWGGIMNIALIVLSGIVIIVWLWIKIYCVFFEIEKRLSSLEFDVEIIRETIKRIEED